MYNSIHHAKYGGMSTGANNFHINIRNAGHHDVMVDMQKGDLLVTLAQHKEDRIEKIEKFIYHVRVTGEHLYRLEWMFPRQHCHAADGHHFFINEQIDSL